MTDLTEFQQRAAAVALTTLLYKKSYFDISALRELADLLGRENVLVESPDYRALHAMHCANWADMGPELTRLTREKCLELLGIGPELMEAALPAARRDTAPEPVAARPSFWQRVLPR